MATLHHIRCNTCNGEDHDCKRCIGRGWLWSDGRPPTSCPAEPTQICQRAVGKCRLCGRPATAIGLDPDVIRTWDKKNAEAD